MFDFIAFFFVFLFNLFLKFEFIIATSILNGLLQTHFQKPMKTIRWTAWNETKKKNEKTEFSSTKYVIGQASKMKNERKRRHLKTRKEKKRKKCNENRLNKAKGNQWTKHGLSFITNGVLSVVNCWSAIQHSLSPFFSWRRRRRRRKSRRKIGRRKETHTQTSRR